MGETYLKISRLEQTSHTKQNKSKKQDRCRETTQSVDRGVGGLESLFFRDEFYFRTLDTFSECTILIVIDTTLRDCPDVNIGDRLS